MSTSRAFAALAALAALGLGVSFFQAWRLGVDEAEHEAYLYSLRRATELDARLDEEVANSRLGLVTHYDGLVRVWDRLGANRDALREPPLFVSGADRGSLVAAVSEYSNALDRKRELVERFKTDQAVLRNSLRSLPHTAERMLERRRVDGDAAPLASEVQALVSIVFRQVAAPRAPQLREAHRRLSTVAGAGGDGAPDVELVTRHAREALERHAAVTRAVAQIMELDVSGAAERAQLRYRALHEAALSRARGWWASAVVSGALLLAFVAAFVIARLRRERDREAELARLKNRFVSMTSHEFRTPLSVILSSAELLEAYGEGWAPEKRDTHVRRVQEAAHAMTKMLDQVLLIGRAEAGMLELRPRKVDLRTLVDAVAEEAQTAAREERSVALEVEGELGEAVADERLLRHALTNLLSNALKYSPPQSRVRFSARAQRGVVTFAVSDEGIGIPEAERARLFDAFHRCSNAETFPGTGLGLAVVKRSVEAHGGTVDVDSEMGRGSTFTVRVPLMGGRA